MYQFLISLYVLIVGFIEYRRRQALRDISTMFKYYCGKAEREMLSSRDILSLIKKNLKLNLSETERNDYKRHLRPYYFWKTLLYIFIFVPLVIMATYFLFSYFSICDRGIPKDNGRVISELGIVYKGMPKEYLANAGFTEYLLLDCKKQGDKEWMTFSDWTTSESGDRI